MTHSGPLELQESTARQGPHELGLKFPDREKALAKIRDLTMLTDILPTGFHGAVTAKVGVGSTVYVAGAGPVGLAAAASARILGAAVVMIGDTNTKRLAHAKKVGFEPIDLNKSDKLGERGGSFGRTNCRQLHRCGWVRSKGP